LWPHVAAEFDAVGDGVREAPRAREEFEPLLSRFAGGFEQPDSTTEAGTRDVAEPRPEYEWVSPASVQVGTVVHRYLQQIADTGPERWTFDGVRARTTVFRRELALLGVEEHDLEPAARRVADAVCDALEDPRGRWVLGRHAAARSELTLTARTAAGLEHLRLDRTFVDRGVRWIIDFKTSVHEGAETELFLDAEVERYRAQLERYAALMASIEDRPIRVGLYFPLLRAFRSWSPGGPADRSARRDEPAP
jgi:ATP-dependent exoDNAse (exonuclease V) beta subunit